MTLTGQNLNQAAYSLDNSAAEAKKPYLIFLRPAVFYQGLQFEMADHFV